MIDNEEKVTAWHFLREDRRLSHDDGRKVVEGETLSISAARRVTPGAFGLHAPAARRVTPCEFGLHASEWLVDAIKFASGPILCLVEVWGDIARHGDDIIAGRHRKVLEMHDVTRDLREYACDVAQFALENELSFGRDVDPRSYDAIATARAFASGDASLQDLDTAAHAAAHAADGAASAATAYAAAACAARAAYAAAHAASEAAYAPSAHATSAYAHATSAAEAAAAYAAYAAHAAAACAVERIAIDTLGARFKGQP